MSDVTRILTSPLARSRTSQEAVLTAHRVSQAVTSERPTQGRPIAPLAPWGSLPRSVCALYVTTAAWPAHWLRELLASDSAMTVTIEQVVGGQAALARLREESFDVVLVRHAPAEVDALQFAEGHRAAGFDDPLVVLGRHADHELAPLCYEVGADAYLMCQSMTARQILWAIGRAIQWRRLQRDNTRLTEVERNRLRLEHNEAERLLQQQRGLVTGLEQLAHNAHLRVPDCLDGLPQQGPSGPSSIDLPASLVSDYRDLLRAHVIMGSGNLAAETAALVDALAAKDLSGQKVMQLHVHALEEALRGLGSRGSRHVMARADLLVLEIMMQLVERYRSRARTSASG